MHDLQVNLPNLRRLLEKFNANISYNPNQSLVTLVSSQWKWLLRAIYYWLSGALWAVNKYTVWSAPVTQFHWLLTRVTTDYKIKYNEHNSGKVVERFVEECQEKEYIGCLGKSAKTPLKMLYVTGDETMWTDCSRIEDTSDTPNVDGKLHFCSRSDSASGSFPPFTFDLERFKKK